MELNEIAGLSQSSSSMSQLTEEPTVCPLCSQEVRKYFINFTEKIEMCKNIDCVYPFGYETMKILKEDSGAQCIDNKSVSQKSNYSNSTVSSLASNSGWSDVEKMCNIFGNDGIPGLDLDQIKRSELRKKTDAEIKNEEIQKNVEKIRQMTKSMKNMQQESKSTIKNEKWLKNLSYLQGLSGFNLMKPEEMKKIKKKVPVLGTGELKIDIDKNNSSNIKIQINSPSEAN